MKNDEKPDDVFHSDIIKNHIRKNILSREVVESAVMELGSSQNNFSEITIFDENRDYLLSIEFSATGLPNGVYLKDQSLENTIIVELNKKAVKRTKTGTKIVRHFCFSTHPIEERFRYDDKFQILPIPDDNPRHDKDNYEPGYASHPFILEIQTDVYNDSSETFRQSIRAYKEIELILFAVSGGRIKGQSQGQHQHGNWVITRDADNHFTTEYKIVRYHTNYLQSLPTDRFSCNEDSPFTVQADAYYGYNVLSFDANSPLLLNQYYELDDKHKEVFLVASYWIRHATFARFQSLSSAYIALVSAIEAFSNALPQTVKCDECNSIKDSGKRFRQTALNLLHFDENFTKILYTKRSKYAHGSYLTKIDIEGFYMNDPVRSKDYHILNNMLKHFHFALIDWLKPEVREKLYK